MLQVREYLLSDVVIVGAGIAGCKAAIEACEYGSSVLLVDQSSAVENLKRNNPDPMYASSNPAQYPENNWEQHAKDTYEYGDYIGDISLISLLSKEALRNSWELDRPGSFVSEFG